MSTKVYRILFLFILSILSHLSFSQETKRIYLSGKGVEDAVEWDFYCSEGRRSGVWTKIPVPSCWELHGFGTYNYGHDKIENRGLEKGYYKVNFKVPEEWKGKAVNILFEGSMTDTEVFINGKLAGAIHQ